jgi:hypothetical protein
MTTVHNLQEDVRLKVPMWPQLTFRELGASNRLLSAPVAACSTRDKPGYIPQLNTATTDARREGILTVDGCSFIR